MDLGVRCPGVGWHDTAVGSPQVVTHLWPSLVGQLTNSLPLCSRVWFG